ncbi:MAG: helix-turn-helix domain-containing protein [Alphaproteobacteria bacterium]
MSHLKKLLVRHGINQVELARILNRDKSVVTNLFQGKRQLKADEAALIARHIGVPVAEVMGLREADKTGFSEPENLIPFQAPPSNTTRKSPAVVRIDGKYYLDHRDVGLSSKLFALEVKDDSLNLSGVLAGDIVVAEMDRNCKVNQLVVVQYYQGRGATTLIRRNQPPFLMPHSTEQKFKPLSTATDDVRVVAPVMKLIRAF